MNIEVSDKLKLIICVFPLLLLYKPTLSILCTQTLISIHQTFKRHLNFPFTALDNFRFR